MLFRSTPQPSATLSGTVTDGSGAGWPLHARIGIPGYPDGAVYTDPVTGHYSVTLPQGDYTLDISTDAPGYPPVSQPVTIGGSDATHDVALTADLTACTAPGYGWNGSSTDFTGWAAAKPSEGWAITGSGWRFDNPGGRSAPQTPPTFLPGGDDNFAVADSGAGGHLDTRLTSPALDLSGQSAPQLQFDTNYYGSARQRATVELSVNGGRTWTSVWQRSTANAIDHVTVALPSAAGHRDVRVRFHYTGQGGWYWALDDVFVGTHTCVARPGGLVVGVVSDATAHQPVNGARVTDAADPRTLPWPVGIAQVTADPAFPGGYYWLFVPGGTRQLTTAAAGYDTATSTVDAGAHHVTRRDVPLTAHGS